MHRNPCRYALRRSPKLMPTATSTDITDLRTRVGEVMVRDRVRLERRIESAGHQRDPKRREQAVTKLVTEIEAAEQLVARRAESVPKITYPGELPIVERKEELLQAIADNQVVIVAGETGSGKSTQIPKMCLELGRGVRGLVGHTQPRRLAARTIAERVAEELHGEVGGAVGYAVRFTDRVGENTLIKVMTDGILLAETQRDRDLLGYDTLIVDEAHERSLNIDFLLGYLKQLLPQRPDLKLIITSATIDTERFSQHFDDAPVIEVSGRTYPVHVRYRPLGEEGTNEERGEVRDQVQAIVDAVEELRVVGPGDVLVFLSGEREIHDTADALRRAHANNRTDNNQTNRAQPMEVLPLYARLSAAEQHRIFQPHQGRRVVLATNVAETSLTVPGIRYVVDAGTARISRYSRRLKVQRLPIEAISQASANQRAGRCGRVAPGVCIRLYAEDDYAARPEFTEPEILRTNLASVILQMASLGLGDVAKFPFVDPPDPRSIKDGVALLEELGAFDPDDTDPNTRLTPLGRKLAQLPVDPRFGRMVLAAEDNNCVRELIVIAAALSIQDPRERPAEAREAANAMHARFNTDGSDFAAFVRLWDYLREKQQALSSNQFRKLCRAEFLNYLRVREWQDIASQLRQVVGSLGIHGVKQTADADRIHLSLLSGLLSQIGMRDGETREFRGARNARFVIGQGSAVSKKLPKWVMAAELVETNRLYARVVAPVTPEWAEKVGGHLCKYSYSEPRWDPKRGGVVAIQRVSLFGLPVVTGRSIDFARIDPVTSRELFIQHALVERDWETNHAFLKENQRRMAEVRLLEDRVRRRDILISDDGLFAFYERRVPGDVTSAQHFDKWWKAARATEPDLLTLTHDELLTTDRGRLRMADFPDAWQHGGHAFPLSYVFDPDSPLDGLTVHVPLPLLSQVSTTGFDWQIAGHREELVTSLIKSLPKNIRRLLIPLADHARSFVAEADPSDGPLLEVLSDHLTRVTAPTGIDVWPDNFDVERLADYLRITFSIVDDSGRALAAGKDLIALQGRLGEALRHTVVSGAPSVERRGLRDWTIGELPKVVETVQSGHTVRGYPALVDDNDSVGVKVFMTKGEQERSMRAGTRRLLDLTVAAPRTALERLIDLDAQRALMQARCGNAEQLIDDCVLCAIGILQTNHGGPAWSEAGFRKLRDAVRSELFETVSPIVTEAARIVVAVDAIEHRIDRLTAATTSYAVADIDAQLAWLVHPGFVTASGAKRLSDITRYMRAIERRLDKVASDPGRDQQRMRIVHELESEVNQLLEVTPPGQGRALMAIRWLIEELRVNLFAQAIGTPAPISETRIRKLLAEVRGGS